MKNNWIATDDEDDDVEYIVDDEDVELDRYRDRVLDRDRDRRDRFSDLELFCVWFWLRYPLEVDGDAVDVEGFLSRFRSVSRINFEVRKV